MACNRVALFSLDEYESAKEAFEAAHALDKRRESETWIRKCDAELKGVRPLQPVPAWHETSMHLYLLQEVMPDSDQMLGGPGCSVEGLLV